MGCTSFYVEKVFRTQHFIGSIMSCRNKQSRFIFYRILKFWIQRSIHNIYIRRPVVFKAKKLVWVALVPKVPVKQPISNFLDIYPMKLLEDAYYRSGALTIHNWLIQHSCFHLIHSWSLHVHLNFVSISCNCLSKLLRSAVMTMLNWWYFKRRKDHSFHWVQF